MGDGTPTPAEIGEELIQLISETATRTGLSVPHVAEIVRQTTHIHFKIENGRLNITEKALRAMEWKLAYARAKCRTLEQTRQTLESAAIGASAGNPGAAPENFETTVAASPDPIAVAAYAAGYFVPTAAEEQRIRQKYWKSVGHYRELSHPVWNDLRLATGTNMYSRNEVANFIHGASIRDILAYRVSTHGNIRSSTNGIPAKVSQPREKETEPFNLIDAIFSIPWYAWIGGFFLIIWVLAVISPGGNRNFALERAEQKARSGQGAEMTTKEADEFRKKQETDSAEHTTAVTAVREARQSRYSTRELEVYRYMRGRFQSYGDRYNPSVHDDLIASEAASRFGVSASEATNIFIRVDAH